MTAPKRVGRERALPDLLAAIAPRHRLRPLLLVAVWLTCEILLVLLSMLATSWVMLNVVMTR